MKKYYLLLTVLMLIPMPGLLSQYDARRLPECLDINYENRERAENLKRKIYYKNFPPEAYQKNKGPDRIMADGFEIKNLSGGNNNQSETWITYNPANPNNLVAGSNDYRYLNKQSGYRMGAYTTTDGFKSWTHSATPDNNGVPITIPAGFEMLVFDPGLAFDSRGWCYYSYGVTQIDGQQRDYDNGLFVCRSKDGGKSWEEQVPVVYTSQGTLWQEFHDRYSIIADANANSVYKDNIYLTWKRFIKSTGILFSKSTNAGEDWSQPTLIPGGNNNDSQSSIPIVGPNGEIYIVWRNPNNGYDDIMFQKSTNAGASWLASPKKIQSVIPIGTVNSLSGRDVLVNKQNMRVSSLAYIAVDLSDGPRRGYIYVVQTGKDESGLTRLYLAKSTNGGNDWTNKIRIDDNQYGNDMFFPSISVDPVTEMISVLYYNSQNDPNNIGFDAYLAVSSDGTSFRNIKLTPQMIYVDMPEDIVGENGNYYWGDYTSITSYNGKIYPCWWMPSGYNTRFFTNDVYVALLSTNPKPPTLLTAFSDYQSPNSVTLRWNDPTVNQLSEPLGDFQIVIYRDGNEISRVNKGIQTYIDGTAIDGQQYTYSIKALTSGGAESSQISVTVYAGGALKPYPPTKIIPRSISAGINLSWTNPLYHTDSTYSQDVIKIDIYVDSVKYQTYNGAIQPGQEVYLNLSITANKFHIIKLKAVGKRGQIETESDFSDMAIAYAGEPLTILNDNFDITPDPVATYTNGTWAKTNVKAVSLPNSMTDSPTGNYENNSRNYIYFPPVIIKSPDTTLSFEHIAIIHNKGDAGIVWISTDFGYSWKSILSVNSDRSPGFTNDIGTSAWFKEGVGLSDYTGDTVMIAFELYSNNFNVRDGWYIDDLRIDDTPSFVEDKDYLSPGLTMESYPNPVNSITKIVLANPLGGNTEISFYDIFGKKLETIFEGKLNPGEFSIDFNVLNLSDGIYFCRANVGKVIKTIPVIVNK